MQASKFLITFFIFSTLLFAQSNEVCEGHYESILHDSSSGINQQELSHMEADKKGYNLTLKEDGNQITLYKGEGCPYCKNTGYKGRVAIFELMTINERIRNLITSNVSTGKLREVAIQEGMHLLKEDGFKKVNQGITTIDEVLRVASS